jgi:hypothetical protein
MGEKAAKLIVGVTASSKAEAVTILSEELAKAGAGQMTGAEFGIYRFDVGLHSTELDFPCIIVDINFITEEHIKLVQLEGESCSRNSQEV